MRSFCIISSVWSAFNEKTAITVFAVPLIGQICWSSNIFITPFTFTETSPALLVHVIVLLGATDTEELQTSTYSNDISRRYVF